MRTEQDMFDIILGLAREDERVRAVYMNGSRTNPKAPKDNYQDYDIVYVVTDVLSFLQDRSWLMKLGSPLIIQEPDWIDNSTGWFGSELHDFSRRYTWLMLFDDGNRIDLGVEIKEDAVSNFVTDKLTIVLLDKDNILPEIEEPSDIDFHVNKPTESEYIACCNEFWWCLNNVAKGIARDELPYAMEMYNHYVRDMPNKMIEWHIGTLTDFSVSTGKMGKYFKKYLPQDLYHMYAATYSNSDYKNLWAAIDVMCDLFHILAISVGEYFGFSYKQNEEDGMRKYLEMVKKDL